MKKQTKIITLVLSLALLVGSVIGISVSAETTEPSISIESYNVSFSGELHLFYAVNTSNVAKEGAEVTKTGIKLSLSPSTEADREIFEATASTEKYKDTDYPTFYSFGIPAKNLDDVIYATPYAEYSDSTTVTGEEAAYSVLEYCYQMVFVDANAAYDAGNITADKCYALKKALRSLLSYGEDVQKYLAYETEYLPSNYRYIAAKDTTVNGENTVFVHDSAAPDTVSLVYSGTNPEGQVFVGWEATYLDGTTELIQTYTTVLENNLPSSLTENKEYNITEEVASAYYTPVFVSLDRIVTFEDVDPYLPLLTNTNPSGDSLFRFNYTNDPADSANKVLSAICYSTAYNSSKTASATELTRPDTLGSEPNVLESSYVFEGDFRIDSVKPNGGGVRPDGTIFKFGYYQGGNQSLVVYNLNVVDGAVRIVGASTANTSFGLQTAIGYDEWFHLEVVLYKNNGTDAAMRITVTAEDGTQYVGTVAASALSANDKSSTRVQKFKLTWNNNAVNKTVYLDNLSFVKNVGVTDLTITETTSLPAVEATE